MHALIHIVAIVASLAVAPRALAEESKNWATPFVGIVARIQIAALKPVEGAKEPIYNIVPFVSMNAPLARVLTVDLAQSKLVQQKDIMLEPGPFLILRSASNGILGVCELCLDGGFIPRKFRVQRGLIILGGRITERKFRYQLQNYLNSDAWRGIHHLWQTEMLARKVRPSLNSNISE